MGLRQEQVTGTQGQAASDEEEIGRHGGGLLHMPYTPGARKKAEAAGKLRGAAAQHGYFGHVYGKIGGKIRARSVPIGGGAALVGAAGLAAREHASKSVAVSVMPVSTKERKQEAHRKRTQAALSSGAALGTLAGFGMHHLANRPEHDVPVNRCQ